tara:strand:- start:238 stop:438 length:201 start_codon:yes stop_codon:yes gene_type:complete
MMTEVEILALALEVEESDLVLKVTDLVANCNKVSGSENGVREDFAEERDFVEHFGLSHNFFVLGFL